MSTKQFIVKVYTPKGKVLEKSTTFLNLPGKSGDIGVHYGHTPSLVECKQGQMVLKTQSHSHAYFLNQAMVKIGKESVVLLVNHLEPVENIDKKRATLAKERAENRLEASKTDATIDVARAKQALERATVRLAIIDSNPLN